MRLISWNVLQGGGQRCGSIAATLLRYDPDIVILQETLSKRGPDLCHALSLAGFAHCLSAPRGDGQRGLCLLSRLPLQRVREPSPPHSRIYPRGWLEVELLGSGRRIAAVYAPAEGPAVPAFWGAAAKWLKRRTAVPFIMLGDFNAGASVIDAEGYRFKAGPSFARLTEIGLVDLWRREHGDKREHTWFSHLRGGGVGRGFRIDHAFASASLASRVTSCRYDHEVRTRGWSDHSLLIVELDSDIASLSP